MTASPRITFGCATGEYSFPAPEWRYATTVVLARRVQPVLPQGYTIWDDGIANDYRICKCTFVLNASEADTMNDLFREPARGRYLDVGLRLPAGSGFYPFGPDRGDYGSGTVRVIGYSQSEALEEPYLHFRSDLTMVCIGTWPGTTLIPNVAEGDLWIAGVAELRHPPDWAKSQPVYDVAAQLTGSGQPYTVDRVADRYEVTLPLVLSRVKAGSLFTMLRVGFRDTTFAIIAQGDNYIFGRDRGGAGTYICQWLDETVEFVHEAWDQFTVPLRFYMVSST